MRKFVEKTQTVAMSHLQTHKLKPAPTGTRAHTQSNEVRWKHHIVDVSYTKVMFQARGRLRANVYYNVYKAEPAAASILNATLSAICGRDVF